MALDQVKAILLRIKTDADYRQVFQMERNVALEKYRFNLTEEEIESLMKLPQDDEALAERVADPVVPIKFVGDIRS